DLANAFLNAKQALVNAGEMSPRTWDDYKTACELTVKEFGKNRPVADLRPEDFEKLRGKMAKSWGPLRLGNAVQQVRSLFKYASDSVLIASPVHFGPSFKKPSRKTVRVHKAKQGAKLFTAEEIRRMLDRAKQPLRAMILLGVNCGYGNSD